ncbi:MAG: hypothetical protein NC405_09055 [Odoribacter sp.]|nr:hypothetical protein [Odoribacter sp.]
MKKIYFLLLSILLTAISASAQTEYSMTVKWDTPGAVEIRYGFTTWAASTPEDIPATATSFTKTTTYTTRPLFVRGTEGYIIESASYVTPTGATGSVAVSNGQVSLAFSSSTLRGSTIIIKTRKLEASTFTIDVKSGLEALKSVYLGPTNTKIELTQGKNSFEFYPSVNNTITFEIATTNDYECFNITRNGQPVKWDAAYRCFYPQLAPGDEFVIEYSKTFDYVTVDLDITPGAEGCIKSIFDRTSLQNLTPADGKLLVERDHRISVNIDEEYDISSATYTVPGSAPVSFEQPGEGFSFIVKESGTLKIDAAPKQYHDVIYTAYVVCPEGIEIFAGNRLTGQQITLTDGQVVDTPISLPKSDIDDAMVIPAGTAYKYTFSVSSKYGFLNINPNPGYWIRTRRLEDTDRYASNPVTSTTFYVVAEKIENDSKAAVFVESGDRKVKLTSSSVYGGGAVREFATGSYVYDFDHDYQSPFSVRPTGEAIDNMCVYLDGTAVKIDENGIWSGIELVDGSVLHIFADGKMHSPSTITFTGVDTEVKICRYVPFGIYTTVDVTTPVNVFGGEELTIKPRDGYTITANGTALTAGADGLCHYTATDGVQTIAMTAVSSVTPVITPEDGSTTESLAEIIIAFPGASAVERNQAVAADEAFLVSGFTYGSISVDCEPADNAEGLAMKLIFGPEPTAAGVYNLTIPEGFFLVDGANSKLIEASFTLESTGEISWTAFPDGPVDCADMPMVAFVFDENLSIAPGEAFGDIFVEFNGMTELTAGTDYEIFAEGSNLVIMPAEAWCKPGTLTVYAPEGALLISGKPSPELYWSWTLVRPAEYTFSFTPDSDVTIEEFKSITITIEGATEATLYEQAAGAAYLRGDYQAASATYAYQVIPAIAPVADSDTPAFILTLDPAPAVPGEYELYLPAGIFYIDGMSESPVINKTFKFNSGIGSIGADDAAAGAIYNLQGIRLDSSWNELPAGLYIRDGKKVAKLKN